MTNERPLPQAGNAAALGPLFSRPFLSKNNKQNYIYQDKTNVEDLIYKKFFTQLKLVSKLRV